MKNHWLNKKQENVCNEISDCEEVKVPDDDTPKDVCFTCVDYTEAVSETQCSLEIDKAAVPFTYFYNEGISDMEIKDGEIQYKREIKLGCFTFKDAGNLGFDIFYNDVKLGWLNNQGEKDLYKWLGDKSFDCIKSLDEEKDVKSLFIEDQFNKKKIQRYYNGLDVVSNESVKGHLGFYKLEHMDIVPGSVLFTAYVNTTPIQTECLTEKGTLIERDFLPRNNILSVQTNFKEGEFIVNWATFPEDSYLSFCYEYYKAKI